VKAGKLLDAIDQAVLLAKYPNVSVKLSAAPNYSTEAYPFRDFTPHIRRLFDAYGPQRCYWGTDITNGFAKATYKQRITHFTEELTFLSEQDKDWIMGRAILARLGWREGSGFRFAPESGPPDLSAYSPFKVNPCRRAASLVGARHPLPPRPRSHE